MFPKQNTEPKFQAYGLDSELITSSPQAPPLYLVFCAPPPYYK